MEQQLANELLEINQKLAKIEKQAENLTERLGKLVSSYDTKSKSL